MHILLISPQTLVSRHSSKSSEHVSPDHPLSHTHPWTLSQLLAPEPHSQISWQFSPQWTLSQAINKHTKHATVKSVSTKHVKLHAWVTMSDNIVSSTDSLHLDMLLLSVSEATFHNWNCQAPSNEQTKYLLFTEYRQYYILNDNRNLTLSVFL